MQQLSKFINLLNNIRTPRVRRRGGRKGRIRKRAPGLRTQSHLERIRVMTYSLNIDNTSFPLTLYLNERIRTSQRMLQLCTLFQQWNLVKFKIITVPELFEGTVPFTLYMLTSMDSTVVADQENILEKGIRLPNNKNFNKIIRSSGHQNDFNYWNDCKDITLTTVPSIVVAFTTDNYGRIPKGSYIINFEIDVMFRYPQDIIPPSVKLVTQSIHQKENFKEGEEKSDSNEDVFTDKKPEKQEEYKNDKKIKELEEKIKKLESGLVPLRTEDRK